MGFKAVPATEEAPVVPHRRCTAVRPPARDAPHARGIDARFCSADEQGTPNA